MREQEHFDLVIVGSGFGGALLSMIAIRLGLRVLLLEKGSHPRFAIGESTSPLTNLLLEEIANSYNLPFLLPLSQYGTWKQSNPEIVCGPKRGFTFYCHEQNKSFDFDPARRRALYVAASPSLRTADTHWMRSDVDNFLVQQAVALGVNYRDNSHVSGVPVRNGATWQLEVQSPDDKYEVHANFMVDASGPEGWLKKTFALKPSQSPHATKIAALYTHFVGVRDTASICDFKPMSAPPYPPDVAAVHHLFDGGWIWVLKFDNGVTSAGVAAESRAADRLGLADGPAGWERLLQHLPSVKKQFQDALPTRPFTYVPSLRFQSQQVVGDHWAMLPSSASFADPLFSTGFPLTLLGITRLGEILKRLKSGASTDQLLQLYERQTLIESDRVSKYVEACYTAFGDMDQFEPLSMYYFAAASFSEIARRADRKQLACGFLLANNERLWTAFDSSIDRDTSTFSFPEISDAIASINIAGLCESAKNGIYPVDLDDVVQGADKLGFTSNEMLTLLDTADWAKA